MDQSESTAELGVRRHGKPAQSRCAYACDSVVAARFMLIALCCSVFGSASVLYVYLHFVLCEVVNQTEEKKKEMFSGDKPDDHEAFEKAKADWIDSMNKLDAAKGKMNDPVGYNQAITEAQSGK